MNHTPNYTLSQWEKSDKVLMDDFNADNAKIDGALKAEADARAAGDAALQTVLAGKGNCSVGTFTYTGNGTCGQDDPTVITFPKMPAAFIIIGDCLLVAQGGSSTGICLYSGSSYAILSTFGGMSWSGCTAYLRNGNGPPAQANSATTYTVIAFYPES